jgi:hypothetical protein
MRKLPFLVGTIFAVGALHAVALLFHWYFFVWWYDVMMHALGGFAMAILGRMVWDYFVRDARISTPFLWLMQLGFVLGFVAIIGIGWEWFEGLCDVLLSFTYGVATAQLGLIDTMLDLYFDLVGAFCGWLVLCLFEKE